ncbi:MAG: sulfotransferase domain-containing protein, partial [Lysobacterales bacterium]
LYEPIHPDKVAAMQRLHLFEYQRPEQENAALYALVKLVMTGTLNDSRANHANKLKLYPRLLVKDIFAHLLARWTTSSFPSVKPILIMRHPFDVAASKSQRQNWSWMTEPGLFLQQTDLVEDHLKPFEDLIRTPQSYFEKQITIWAIIHYVWFRQFKKDECQVVFYENLCRKPEIEVSRLGEFIGRPGCNVEEMIKYAVSSAKSGPALDPSEDQLWPQFSAEEKKRGHEILTRFGLGHIYGARRAPLINTDLIFKK